MRGCDSKAKSEFEMVKSKLDLVINIEGSPWLDQGRTGRVLILVENVLGFRHAAGRSLKVPRQPIQVETNMSNLQRECQAWYKHARCPRLQSQLAVEPRISPNCITLSSASFHLTFLYFPSLHPGQVLCTFMMGLPGHLATWDPPTLPHIQPPKPCLEDKHFKHAFNVPL